MQQLYLVGSNASILAAQLVRALGVQAVGYTMQPFCIAGRVAGQALHLLTPPGEKGVNDLPCRIDLGHGQTAVVAEALNLVAAPALRRALSARAPMLLDDVDAALLSCEAFARAVQACIHGEHLTICVAREDAQSALRRMSPAQEQFWLDASADNALEILLSEARMRL